MRASTPVFIQPLKRRCGVWNMAPHSHAPLAVARRAAQGAGSGLLLLSGVGALVFGETDTAAAEALASAAALSSNYNLFSVEGLMQALLSGAFNDSLQIAGAMVIFMTAGQCIARFFGLAAVFAAFFLYAQGVTLGEAMTFFNTTVERVEAARTAFADPALVGEK